MDGLADTAGIRLSDPAAPINPEQAAEALGTMLLERHDADADQAGLVTLAGFAAAVRAEANARDDAPIGSGPYLDRSRQELARLAAETVDALPATDSMGSITPGLSLDAVTLGRDGSLTIEGATVAGDRHLDLARTAVALAIRFGPAVVAPFLDAYGLDRIDLRRLDTCQLLTAVADELGVAEPVEGP